jgi:hypothetical protein
VRRDKEVVIVSSSILSNLAGVTVAGKSSEDLTPGTVNSIIKQAELK